MKTRFKPTTTTRTVEVKHLGIEVFVNDNELVAIGYQGRANKSSFRYRFKTIEKMNKHIEDFVERYQSIADYKKEQRDARSAKMREAKKNVKVGDIYVASWGYSMTIVDAYQVVEVKGASVVLREISNKVISGDAGYYGTVKPVKDDFTGEPFTKRIADAIKISESQRAYKWDGKREFSFNRMD